MDNILLAYKAVGERRYRETNGLYWEDFEPGDVFEHRPGRTVLDVDNTYFTLLTLNIQPVHFDAAYAALAAVLMIGSAEAQEGTSHFSVIGAGTASCGSWTAHRRAGRAFDFQEWVGGFLAGIGYLGAPKLDPLHGVDPDGLTAWIDNYCQAHPLEHLASAAAAFAVAHPR